MADGDSLEVARTLRQQADNLEVMSILQEGRLRELKADNARLKKLLVHIEEQMEDAAIRLLQQTENELQRQEDALQRLRSIRNDECDKLRQLVVMNVMDRVVDIVSTTCAMLERICLSECPPKDKWDIPSPVLAAGNSMSTSNVLSLSTVCRLVDERLAATKQTLAGLLEPPLP